MVVFDILNFLVAIVTIVSGYKLFIERAENKKRMSELKGLSFCFGFSLVMLWVMNIFIGFIK